MQSLFGGFDTILNKNWIHKSGLECTQDTLIWGTLSKRFVLISSLSFKIVFSGGY